MIWIGEKIFVILQNLAKEIINIGPKNKVVISSAESCTGGMIGAAITSIPGSSIVYDRGFITYSNNSKAESSAEESELPLIIMGLTCSLFSPNNSDAILFS